MLFFKANQKAHAHIASQPRLSAAWNTKGVLTAIGDVGIIHILSTRNCV